MENFAGNYITKTIKYFCFMLSAHFAMIPDRHYSERTFFYSESAENFSLLLSPKRRHGIYNLYLKVEVILK